MIYSCRIRGNAITSMRILIPCLLLLKCCLANQPDLPFDPTSQVTNEICWERCFQVEDDDLERFREVYDDFYKMGMEARKLKNMFGINGTAILLDSTLSAKNPSEPWEAFYSSPRVNNTAFAIWEFQRNLAAITMILMGTQDDHNPIYLSQFNEESANSCEEFHCLHACEADYILDSELDVPDIDTYKDGHIEAACSISKRFMSTTPCLTTLKNAMAIAFLNSGIKTRWHHHHHHRHEVESVKPCMAHFDSRMAIGTHVARWEDLDKWSSRAAKPFYFHGNAYTMEAAARLRMCLRKRCCPTGQNLFVEGIAGNVCKISIGPEGDTVLDYPVHGAGSGVA